jgi:hypothetical protein
MNKEQCIQLINAEIDGNISDHDKERLHKYLNQNPEMKQLYLQLINSQNILNRTADTEPPSDLKKTILSSIDENRYAVSKNGGLLNFIKNCIVSTRPVPKYAFSFSVGLVLGAFAIFALYQDIEMTPNMNSKLTGAIISSNFNADFKAVGSLDINKPGLEGRIEIAQSPDFVKVDFYIFSEDAVEISSEFEKGELGFLSFVQENAEVKKIDSGIDSFTFNHKGSNKYSLLFINMAAGQAKVIIKIWSDEIIFKKEIILE